ncbi:MAG: hypothetical protein R3C61_18335 [Bacteroidia bacterium]
MTVVEAFGDIAEVLAGMNPSKIVNLKASPGVAERVDVLVFKKKSGEISEDEIVELERYLALDLLINLAKARAKRILAA